MKNIQAHNSFFNGKKRTTAISSVLFIILLSNITTTTMSFVKGENIALAQSQSGSSVSPISNDMGRINNTVVNKISEQQQQSNQLPSSSQQPKTHEYTLIAEETTLEILLDFGLMLGLIMVRFPDLL